MMFTIRTRTTGNVVVLDVTGRLIMGTAAEDLRATVRRLLQDGQRWLILNLAGVSAVAVQISWVLFLIGIVLVAIHVVTGRSARVT